MSFATMKFFYLLVCIHDWCAMIRTPGWAFRWLVMIRRSHLLTDTAAIWILLYFVDTLLLIILACVVMFLLWVTPWYVDFNMHVIDILDCDNGTFDIAWRLPLLTSLIDLFWAEDVSFLRPQSLLNSHILRARFATSHAKGFRAHTDTFRVTLTLITSRLFKIVI